MAALTAVPSTGRGVEIGIGTTDNIGTAVPNYEPAEAVMDTTESGNNSNNNNNSGRDPTRRRSAEAAEEESRDNTIAAESVWRPY